MTKDANDGGKWGERLTGRDDMQKLAKKLQDKGAIGNKVPKKTDEETSDN